MNRFNEYELFHVSKDDFVFLNVGYSFENFVSKVTFETKKFSYIYFIKYKL
jgi:hypothetical protein